MLLVGVTLRAITVWGAAIKKFGECAIKVIAWHWLWVLASEPEPLEQASRVVEFFCRRQQIGVCPQVVATPHASAFGYESPSCRCLAHAPWAQLEPYKGAESVFGRPTRSPSSAHHFGDAFAAR